MWAHRRHIRSILLGATAFVGASTVIMLSPAQAAPGQYQFDSPAQPLATALQALARVADGQLIFSEDLVKGRTAPPLKGSYTLDEGLGVLLAGTGLVAEHAPGGVIRIRRAGTPAVPAAGAAADPDTNVTAVEELIVTAQKREESIQRVPMAVSAFSEKALTASRIDGPQNLVLVVPNVQFSRRFVTPNFSIRGIGTKLTSTAADPAVGVHVNNAPLTANRLLETEFYDVERVEVLRGPQGTLYGRNANGGVLNVITAKPTHEFAGSATVELGNYDSQKYKGFVNVPLTDWAALRLAGSVLKRGGFVKNTLTDRTSTAATCGPAARPCSWNPPAG